ncbi:MAG TPA: hypothetical protein VEP90_07335, partial [Methylomirabilota bacterium]|nr:hypothetical protein [Methylomirabilota bacterium]
NLVFLLFVDSNFALKRQYLNDKLVASSNHIGFIRLLILDIIPRYFSLHLRKYRSHSAHFERYFFSPTILFNSVLTISCQ